MRRALISVMLLLCPVGVAMASDAAHGWTMPGTDLIQSPVDAWRMESASLYLFSRGDFDGDGSTDAARLLVSPDGRKYGLFVFLASGQTIRLDLEDVQRLRGMGIDSLPPGAHKTACGKGYWACKPGEEPVLNLSTVGVRYFQAESAASVFYWSHAEKKFVRVWLSD